MQLAIAYSKRQLLEMEQVQVAFSWSAKFVASARCLHLYRTPLCCVYIFIYIYVYIYAYCTLSFCASNHVADSIVASVTVVSRCMLNCCTTMSGCQKRHCGATVGWGGKPWSIRQNSDATYLCICRVVLCASCMLRPPVRVCAHRQFTN